MSEQLSIPGGRSVRATIDRAHSVTGPTDSNRIRPETCIIACPPHPQHGGHRGDNRLEALSNAVIDRGIDCLRIDYGDWDEGYGEREDACNAIRWARERYDRVGLFGYSFGGAIALLAAAHSPESIEAVSTLAPASTLGADRARSAITALEDLLETTDCAVQIISGERDSTVDSTPLTDRLEREADRAQYDVQIIPADHFFVGQQDRIAGRAGEFLVDTLGTRD